jgi:hypothetical protein
VAVCGLPEPNEDHAVVMSRFARDCLEKMNELVRKLESSLGPDTADLAMRAGVSARVVCLLCCLMCTLCCCSLVDVFVSALRSVVSPINGT